MVFGSSGLVGRQLIPLLQEKYTVLTVGRQSGNSWIINLENEWSSDTFPNRIDSVIYLAQSEKFHDFPQFAESIFRVNTLSLLKALDYARRAGAQIFVYTSTGGVYAKSDEPLKEETDLSLSGELRYYVSTKICGEILAENYNSFMNVVILRPFFIYGPGQRKEMLIPRLVERVRNGQPIQLIGENGLYINPIYVDDAAYAIRQALTLDKSYKINIAGSEILSIRQIGELIGQALGKDVIFEQKSGTSDQIIGSIEKMCQLLWRPRITFAEGLQRYINSIS